MDISEFLSLLLFIAVSIPAAIRAKLRATGWFPKKNSDRRTVVALPYSPFCEKIFWAYDRAKVPYGVRTVFQGFFPTTLAEFSAASVPIVVVEGEEDTKTKAPRRTVVIKDSKDALHALCDEQGQAWLYPPVGSAQGPKTQQRDVRQLESTLFGDSFGKAVARIVYHHMFSEEEDGKHGGALLKRVWKVDVTPFERLLCEPLYPACRWAMAGGMGLSLRKDCAALKGFVKTVDEVFEKVSEMLAENEKMQSGGSSSGYICGTPGLSAADITFASLAYPLVLPDEKSDVFLSWDRDELPAAFREEVRRRRASPAGQFVLRLYREERGTVGYRKRARAAKEASLGGDASVVFASSSEKKLY